MKKTIALFTAAILLFLATGTVFAGNKAVTDIINPSGLVITKDGTMLITDIYNKSIWSNKNDTYTRLTGDEKIIGLDGVPLGGYKDGTLKQALFESPWAITSYKSGYAVTDTENNVIRYIDTKNVSTIAGNKKAGFVNGKGTVSSFNHPTGLATDKNGNIYIADTGNNCIRKMDINGNVTTYAGGKSGNADGLLLDARFIEPTGLYFKDDILYIADSGNHRVCKIENDRVTTIAGKVYKSGSDEFYQGGYVNGAVSQAEFSNPQGIASIDGIVYISDTGNSSVRKIENGIVSTICERKTEKDLFPVNPRSMVVVDNNIFVCDTFSGHIFSVDIPNKPADVINMEAVRVK